jgi:hypothetical protein
VVGVSWVKPGLAKALPGAAFDLRRELARFGVVGDSLNVISDGYSDCDRSCSESYC